MLKIIQDDNCEQFKTEPYYEVTVNSSDNGVEHKRTSKVSTKVAEQHVNSLLTLSNLFDDSFTYDDLLFEDEVTEDEYDVLDMVPNDNGWLRTTFYRIDSIDIAYIDETYKRHRVEIVSSDNLAE